MKRSTRNITKKKKIIKFGLHQKKKVIKKAAKKEKLRRRKPR